MKKKISIIILVILVLSLFFSSVHVVNDGEVGVKKTLGDYMDREIGTGVVIILPIVSQLYKVNTKLVTIEETVSVPTSEGLNVDLDLSVIFRVRPEMASEIRQTVTGDIKYTLLIPYVRNGIRDIVSGYEAEAVYSETGRSEISAKLQKQLDNKLSDKLVIHDVLLRNVVLPDKVRVAIDTKVEAEHNLQRMEKEKKIAQKQAEIDVARAEGIAESNKIIAGSISEEYLRWKFIEAIGQSGAEKIYIPTEANMPILEARNGYSIN